MDGRGSGRGIQSRVVGVGLGLIRMEMGKWPIQRAGMLWEKMQSRATATATAAGNSSSEQQPKATGRFQGLDRYKRAAGQDGPVRLG